MRLWKVRSSRGGAYSEKKEFPRLIFTSRDDFLDPGPAFIGLERAPAPSVRPRGMDDISLKMTKFDEQDEAQPRREPSKRSEIPSFIAMDMMRAAAAAEAEGRRVIHMEIGQPSTAAPMAALEMARAALNEEKLGYTNALGVDALREKIAASYAARYGLAVDPERIAISTGSSAAFMLAFLAVFDAGDAVALPSPGYPCYRHILSALGCRSPLIETGPESRFMPTVKQLAALDEEYGLSGMMLASPANPTGTMIQRERLKELADYCDRRGLWLISDEIYHGLTYEEDAATALEFSDESIVINSFSKYHSMTGWRIGWLIVPERLVRVVERLQQNLFISAPTISQLAAMGAIDADAELEKYRSVYEENRAYLLEALPSVGLGEMAPPDGAFYFYVDVSKYTDDSRQFAQAMLEEIGIATTPGVDFDEERGKRYLRFSYAGRPEEMRDAIERLRHWPRLHRS